MQLLIKTANLFFVFCFLSQFFMFSVLWIDVIYLNQLFKEFNFNVSVLGLFVCFTVFLYIVLKWLLEVLYTFGLSQSFYQFQGSTENLHPFIFLVSSIYNNHLKYFFLQKIRTFWYIISVSIIKLNLEYSREEEKFMVFIIFLFIVFFIHSWCSKFPSFIIPILPKEIQPFL